MNRSRSPKYIIFFSILLVGIALDQWTKWYASNRLATYRPGYVEHTITLTTPEGGKTTLREFLENEFPTNTEKQLDRIAQSHVRSPDGDILDGNDELEPGQKIIVENRKVTVIEGYWDFEYTENPGAAFGLLSESDSAYRLPFFIVVSLLAIAVILYILRGVSRDQKLLIVSLSFIGTGALGNFIDRIRFGHVIDFVVWKYTDAYRWPTFNVADAFITVGVTLMLAEIIFGNPPEAEAEREGDERG